MLQLHEFDELRFDVRAHDCSYFLRATSVHEKDQWVEAIEANQVSWQEASPCQVVTSSCSCRGVFQRMVMIVPSDVKALYSLCPDCPKPLAHRIR